MKFNIAPLDKAKLIQVLYAYASPKTVIKNEYSSFVNSGEPVKSLSIEECKKIVLKNSWKKSGWRIDSVERKPLHIRCKKISRAVLTMESVPYDLLYGRYRMLQALIAMFNMRDIYITDRHYDSTSEAAFKTQPARSHEAQYYGNLEKAVLMNDDSNNPYWTLNTPMHELGSAFNSPIN
jgi:hypothetical protein